MSPNTRKTGAGLMAAAAILTSVTISPAVASAQPAPNNTVTNNNSAQPAPNNTVTNNSVSAPKNPLDQFKPVWDTVNNVGHFVQGVLSPVTNPLRDVLIQVDQNLRKYDQRLRPKPQPQTCWDGSTPYPC